MNYTNQEDFEEFDMEWMNLILTARKLGLSTDDIRAFLRNPANPAHNVHTPSENEQTYAQV